MSWSTPEALRALERDFDALLALAPERRDAQLREIEAQAPERAAELRQLIARDQRFESDPGTEPALRWGMAATPVAIPGYRLIAQIGAGGMGRVFTAVAENDPAQPVRAVKIMRRELAGEVLAQRFALECEALAALSHPGIARFIESGHGHDGAPFVVMEYVQGEPIDLYCNRLRLRPRARIELVRQLVDALAHAHQRLIIHRDIKPANVLVSAAGQVVLVDFGVAKSLALAPQPATMTAERFLTPRTAAPEQLAGAAVGIGCDIHGVGLLLYGLLCGREPHPFDALDPLGFQQRLLQVPAPSMAARLAGAEVEVAQQRGLRSVAELQAELRGDVAQVVLRCLRKRPEERYASAGDLDRDLRSVLEGRPISERENEPWYRLRKFVLRHRAVFSLAAVAAVCLCVALLALWHQQHRTLHERDRAENAVGLLQESFAAANPLGVQGGQTPLSDVLDAALPLLEARRAEQPELYADLAATLARVELSAGRPRAALRLAERGMDAAQRSGRTAPQHRALALLAARARLEAGELAALGGEIDALALTPGPPREQVEIGLLRGRLAYLQGDVARAVGLLEAALADAATLPAADPLALDVRLYLAHAQRLANRVPEAIALLDAALALQSQHFDAGHPRRLLIRMRRLEYARHLQPAQQSLADVQQLAEDIEQAFGSRSALLARVRGNIAQLHLDLEDTARAAEYFRMSWQGWLAATSAAHPNTLRALFNLAYATSLLEGGADEADRLFRLLLHDARGGGELNQAVLSYWQVSHLELLANRQRCDQAAGLLADSFPASQPLVLNPPTRELLGTVLGTLTEGCGCAIGAAPICSAVQDLDARLAADPTPSAAAP